MITKVKRENNTLTLPEGFLSECGDTEYFTVLTSGDSIILTPSRPTPPPRADGKSAIANIRGEGKGKVRIADDFNAPMEEFAEYM